MNRDKTYCASPGCVGKCGRKPSDGELLTWAMNRASPSWAYFCNDRGEPIEGVAALDAEETKA